MPLTNAEKQAAYAARRKIKLQRLAVYEAALREIVALPNTEDDDAFLYAHAIAQRALVGQGEVQ